MTLRDNQRTVYAARVVKSALYPRAEICLVRAISRGLTQPFTVKNDGAH